MKYNRVVEIIAESYEEEQFLQRAFPEAYFIIRNEKVYFYLPGSKESQVQAVINEYKELKKS
jgi:hypothetical protein